ncbi:hypothetical protein CEE44_03280 [Candidatus Woesearchaeota archaeon B3_Woes]|nr:MAG: hypothetical protein CEE44_03280 [Candidatus Woesearchaeota archaeon B3_Woes]
MPEDYTRAKHVYTDRITIKAAEARIRYRNEFHMKNLYMMLHDWFIEEKYIARDDPKWPEHFYLLREAPIGKEMWIWWRFKKIPSGNNYYRYDLDVFWHVVGAKDIEVMRQGKKFKTQNADLELMFQSYLEMDYNHEKGKGWRDHPLLKHINTVFHKRIFKAELEKHRMTLYRDTYRVQEMVKTFLGMRTYMPEPEGGQYWHEKGVGEKEGIA